MKKFVKEIMVVIIFIVILIIAFNFTYNSLGFGYFSKAATVKESVAFSRDSKVKYSKENSYKIENKDYNNASFFKEIKVKKNTPYKVTCIVKTENIELLNSDEKSGAKISLLNRNEESIALIGNNDWTELNFMFNSKNNDIVEIGFMLAGMNNEKNVKGTAWFSNLTLTEGEYNSSNWNFACFVFKNTNINLDGESYNYNMSENDIMQINECMSRFKKTCELFSNNIMKIDYKIIEIDESIKTVSYDDEKGYFVSEKDIGSLIKEYVNKEHFDYIFSCIRLSDDNSEIPINSNWIGLGGMEIQGMGFSNIKMPSLSKSGEYLYNENLNRFPEEVFIHEFLHTVEKNAKDCGYSIPDLHDNVKYGYDEKHLYGLYKWYFDYMRNNVNSVNGMIGVNKNLYYIKPVTNENFINGRILNNCFNEPKNIIEKATVIVNMII